MRPMLSTAMILLIVAAREAPAQQPQDTPAASSVGQSSAAAPAGRPVLINIAPFSLGKDTYLDAGLLTAQEKKDKELKGKPEPQIEEKQPLAPELFTQSAPQRAEPGIGLNPRMIGEQQGRFSLIEIAVPSVRTINTFQNITTFQPVQVTIIGPNGEPMLVTLFQPVTQTVPLTIQQRTLVKNITRVPVASGGGFKIGENESPIPEDRVFFTYNYYNGLRGPGGPFGAARIDAQQTVLNGFPATITTPVPATPPGRFDLHREMAGFEKTFLDGTGSIGLRVPLLQMHGDGTFSQDDFGDLTAIVKYAPFFDRSTGNVLSGGLAVTFPTGPANNTIIGNIHSTLFQPFVGYRWNVDRFFVQGFSSVVIPTDSRDATLLFNDIGVGYWLYRGNGRRAITGIAPVLEAHVTTPLDHRQTTDAIFVPNIVSFTGGVHVGIGGRSSFTIGVNTPVTGPRPYAVEAIAQFNFWF
jgi:hypothetical protein